MPLVDYRTLDRLVQAFAPAGGTGPTGPAGAPGPYTGLPSGFPTGFLGFVTGPQGATGTTGPRGPSGATGSQGAQGTAGMTGQAGATGPVASGGAPGITGARGPTGGAGAQGPSGVRGPTGPLGVAGASTVLWFNSIDDLGGTISQTYLYFGPRPGVSTGVVSSAINSAKCVSTRDGVLNAAYGRLQFTLPTNWGVKVQVNGVDTALAFTIPIGTQMGRDVSHQAQVQQGDTITVSSTTTPSGNSQASHAQVTLSFA